MDWDWQGFKARAFEFPSADPDIVGLSPDRRARLIYDPDTDELKVSLDGAPYVPLSTGATGPAGADTEVQYNDGGAFGANADFTYDGTSVTFANVALFEADVQLTGAGTARAIASDDGSTAAVSGAAEGRLRYNDTTGTWQVSTQASAYVDVATGATGPAGADTEVQYNDGGAFGANADFTYDGTSVTFANVALFEADVQLTGAGTDRAIASADGSTAAVSGAAEGRLRYNDTTGTWQVSTQTSPYVDIATGSSAELFFNADYNVDDGSFRGRSVGAGAEWNFTFSAPADLGTVTSLVVVGFAVTGGAVGAGKDIDLFSEYGADGESKDNHAESDTTSTYTIPAVDELFGLDISGVFSSLAAGDYCGLTLDHDGIGGTVVYLGIQLIYTPA